MANTDITKFLHTVQHDEALKQQFKAAPDLQACLNIALQSGHTFTAAELQAGLNRLSEEQLAEIVNPGVAPRRHLESN